jgi:UDP-N-acetylmuramoyl-L-alanyl-D-glutamate--2,6-diaminopimelate ligase
MRRDHAAGARGARHARAAPPWPPRRSTASPAEALRFVGVTGTNGKTTTVGMLRHLLDEPGAPAASIGTLGCWSGSEGAAAGRQRDSPRRGRSSCSACCARWWTPGCARGHGSLVACARSAARARRARSTRPSSPTSRATTWTITRRWRRTSRRRRGSSDLLGPQGTAVVNADDPAWRALPAAPRALRFGMTDTAADVRAADVRYTPRGSEWTLVRPGRAAPVRLPLIGDFNVMNALGAAAAALALGCGGRIAARLATLPQVPGASSCSANARRAARLRAHTRCARPRARGAAALHPGPADRGLRLRRRPRPRQAPAHGAGGARARRSPGGDQRQPAHRGSRAHPRRHRAAAARAGATPHRGPARGDRARHRDRRSARDVVLLAGKGHETYQIRGTVSYPFDERRSCRNWPEHR